MIAVAIALLITVVFVDDNRPTKRDELVSPQTAQVEDALPGLLIANKVKDIGTFRRGEFWVCMIDIEARAIWQNLVNRHVVLMIRDVVLVIQLKPSGIDQRVLLIVVPQQLERLVSVVAIHQ